MGTGGIPDIEYAGFLIPSPEDPLRHNMGRAGVVHYHGEKAEEFGASMPDGYAAFQPEGVKYTVIMQQAKTIIGLPSTVGTVYVDVDARPPRVRIQSVYEG
jgi:hypothetical protein